MTTAELVAEIDALMDRLTRAREILASIHTSANVGKQVRLKAVALPHGSEPFTSEASTTVPPFRQE